MLHEPIIDVKHTVYCGPRAIAVLTGVPVSRIEKMLRRCRRSGYKSSDGRTLPIKGTQTGEVIKVLKRLGCKITPMKRVATMNTTLGALIEDTVELSAPCLVWVTGHFCVTFKGKCSDGIVRRNRWVISAWRVEAPAEPKFTTGAPVRQRKPRAPRDLQAERHARVLVSIKRWEGKLKRAGTALKKLRRQARYYERAVSRSRDQSRRTRPACHIPDNAAILAGTRNPTPESLVQA